MVSNKQGASAPWLVPIQAAAASYPDGSTASLWVPAPLRQCFQPGKSVNVARNGSIVVGSVGLWPAHRVSVTAHGKTSESPVTNGYFIIPGSLSVGMTAKFRITLLDKTGASLGTVTNLQASGWGTPK